MVKLGRQRNSGGQGSRERERERMYIYYLRLTPAGSAQRYYTISLRGQEKKKDRKIRKGRSEEKVVGFSSASLFPTR